MAEDLDPKLQAAQALKQDYELTFTTEHGQRVLRHLESVGFYRRSTLPRVEDEPFDLARMAAREGARRMVLLIHEQLEWSITQLLNRPRTAKLEAE